MTAMDRGRELHESETAHAGIEDDLHDDPREALPDLLDLVEGMLRARGIPIDDPVTEAPTEEITEELELARATVRSLRDGQEVLPGDVARAVNGLEAIYATLIVERSAT